MARKNLRTLIARAPGDRRAHEELNEVLELLWGDQSAFRALVERRRYQDLQAKLRSAIQPGSTGPETKL